MSVGLREHPKGGLLAAWEISSAWVFFLLFFSLRLAFQNRTLKDAVVAGLTSSAMPKRRRRRSSSTSSRRSSLGGEGTDGGEPEFGWQRKESRGEESRIELEGAASGRGLFSSGVVDDQEVDTSSLEEGGWGSRAGMGEGDGVEDHEGFRDYEDLQEEEGERGWD